MSIRSIAGCGAFFQIGYVADDLGKAMDFWSSRVGVGPFYLMENIEFEAVRYRGKPSEIDISVAIAYWGDIQIELIHQNNDAPSIYKGWNGQHGVHHMCLVVDDLKTTRDSFLHAGAEIVQEGRLSEEFQFLYADVGFGHGGLVEAITLPAQYRDAFELMKSAARDWNGQHPVRTL